MRALRPRPPRRRPAAVSMLAGALVLGSGLAGCDAQDGRELPAPEAPTPPGAGLGATTSTSLPAAVIAPPPGAEGTGSTSSSAAAEG